MPTPIWSFLPLGEYDPQTALPHTIHIVSSDRPIEKPTLMFLYVHSVTNFSRNKTNIIKKKQYADI